MSLRPGTTVRSHYRIVRTLGQGASGTVYLVRDTRDKGQTWALKAVPEEAEPEARAALQREMDLLCTLRHAGLPQVHETFVEGGVHYLVMERVDGPTLETLQEEAGGRLPEDDVRRYALQLCDVLGYLHGQTPPVLHRDLKPSNCIVSRGGVLKLVDFGIARQVNPARARDTHAWGTPGFCAPEQYTAHSSPASDLYALGATVFVLLTGADPTGYNFKFPDVRVLNTALSAGWTPLLGRALSYHVADRFPDAAAMQAGLRDLQLNAPGLLERVRRWLR